MNTPASADRQHREQGSRSGPPERPASGHRFTAALRRSIARAQQVRAAGGRVAEFGQQDRAGNQRGHDRHAHEEHRAHQKCSSRAPPTTDRGRANGEAGAPNADCFGSLGSSSNKVRISDRVDGTSAAPASPSSARVAMSITRCRERGQDEAAPNAAPPMSSICGGQSDRRSRRRGSARRRA